ncbi:hypothetical protein ACS0TY_006492 [Phlomoides rotata]
MEKRCYLFGVNIVYYGAEIAGDDGRNGPGPPFLSKHPSKDLHWNLLCLGIYNRLDEWCIFQHALALFCNKIHHCTTLHDVVLDQQVSKKEYVYV